MRLRLLRIVESEILTSEQSTFSESILHGKSETRRQSLIHLLDHQSEDELRHLPPRMHPALHFVYISRPRSKHA